MKLLAVALAALSLKVNPVIAEHATRETRLLAMFEEHQR